MKKIIVLLLIVVFSPVYASVNATSVTAQQRYPWNGLVDVAVTIQGKSNEVALADCFFAATNSATRAVIPVKHITRNGMDVGSGDVWTRKFIWDAVADIGAVKIDDVVLIVDAKILEDGQLWENGPCWAECNVGATKPEECGYYFWWGDTVGYKRVGNRWDAVVGSRTGFSFPSENCPTYGKTNSELQSDGYIDETGNLVAMHDAATAHLGAPWRMPTDAEFSALVSNCTTTWTTRNGVSGRLVTGKGDYSSKSVFFPAAGFGDGSDLDRLGSGGFYWSSTPHSDIPIGSWGFYFYSGYSVSYYFNRYSGRSVRPVREVADVSGSALSGATTHLSVDGRIGAKVVDGSHSIVYDASWYEDGVVAKITVDGQEIVSGAAGKCMWMPSSGDVHLLALNVYDASQKIVGTESTFCLSCEDLTELVIPAGTTEVGEHAFVDGQFTSVTIPNGVTNIAPTAFVGCSNIIAVIIGRAGSLVRHEYAKMPIAGASFHVDASDLSTMEIKSENGVDYVMRWNDASGGNVYATAGNIRPVLGTLNSKPIVDFGGLRMEHYGKQNYGAWMRWSEVDESIRDAFIVCCDNPEGNEYRQFVLTSDVGDWAYDFHRSINLQHPLGLFDAECASDYVKNGLVQVDGSTVPYDYDLPDGLHVVRVRTTGNVTANTFAKDREARFGGQQLAEVIIYDSPLTDEYAAKVVSYLREKWLVGGDVLNIRALFPDSSVRSLTIESGEEFPASYCDGCDQLLELTLPDEIGSINERAFAGCESLCQFQMPSSVTNVGVDAFLNCPNLKRVDATSLESWLSIRFRNNEANPLHAGAALYVNGVDMTESLPMRCTVTFDANGGNCAIASEPYYDGSVLGSLPEAIRSGYAFVGWYTAASGGTKVTAAMVVEEDLTLHAHWVAATGNFAIANVEVQQRYPWNGLVDIVVMMQGPMEDVTETEYSFVAVNSATKTAIPVSHITRSDDASGSAWIRKFIWDVAADVGTVKIDDVALTIDAKIFEGVQLWAGGPYWAKCNVGASKPEECGCYFWWGGTVGYERVGNSWCAANGDGTAFEFYDENCWTSGKSMYTLQKDEVIDSSGNLVVGRDAARQCLGKPWRMPTNAEVLALINNCTTTWTTCNGINGRLVTGKGAYSARSIFLPAAGSGWGSYYQHPGESGMYWSSTSDYDGYDSFYGYHYYKAWQLGFSSKSFVTRSSTRSEGYTVRPVREFGSSSAVVDSVTTHFALDCRGVQGVCTIMFEAMGGNPIPSPLSRMNGDAYGILPEVEKLGYSFDGWYTEAIGGMKVDAATTVTGNMTLYAHWKKCGEIGVRPAFHVDASDLSTMEIVAENGENYVVRWDDASGGGIYATAGSVRPMLKTVNDKQIVDFGGLRMESYGSENYGAWMRWSEADRLVREVFIVCCDNPEGNVYRQFVLTSDVSDWTYDFHRSLNLQCAQGLFDEECASDRVKNGLIQVDGTTVSYDYALSEGLHIIHIRTTGNVTANTFAKDRACRYGGLMIAEVIVYDEPLDDETAGKVQQQLIEKWLTHVPVLSVAFETVGGSPKPSPLSKSRGEVYGELPEVQRAGYDFAGWWTASDGGVRVGSADVVQESITLYAHWRILHYKINYDLSGGINAGVNPMSYTVEDAVILADPTREGYDFVGWSPDHGVIAKGSTGDKTFAANWKQRTHVGGLVAWYKFDGNLNDDSGNGYDMQGTIDGYAIGCCSIGQALSFSGGTFVSPENVIEIESSFTISGWLKSEEDIAVVSERSSGIQTNGKMVLTPGHGAVEGAGVGFAYGKNGVAIYEHGSSYLPVVLMYNAAIGTGWNLVTITVADNAAPKLYLNGKFVKQGVQGDRNYRCVKLGKNAASIGGEFYGNRFYGNVDDFRIYNRALSESEIEALCNGESDWQPVDVILPKEVSGGDEITIPAQWVTESLPRQYGEDRKMQFVKMYGSDYGTALLKKSGKVDCAGNELYVWQDYVAGTDPTDSNSLFRAFIDMVNGCPQIRWEPNLNGTDKNRIYTVFGKYELSDEQWHSPTNGRSRFFKVSVEMP